MVTSHVSQMVDHSVVYTTVLEVAHCLVHIISLNHKSLSPGFGLKLVERLLQLIP